ncbi:MAG: RNA-binding S4 domain-containing protein [Bacteroidales bacterium]|nr:MAG: RNA-binding S4 domain-containing protein [Bacteroidales bacterium]
MESFILKEEYIQLDQLLKVLRLVSSGGMAHLMVDDGLVKVDGFVEKRRRAKIRAGNTIEVPGKKFKVIAHEELGD